MEPSSQGSAQDTDSGAGVTDSTQFQASHKRTPSGGGLLSRLSFIRAHSDHHQQKHDNTDKQRPPSRAADEKDNQSLGTFPSVLTPIPIVRQPPSIASALQQQKTRRRRGSLRKVALLGRGAQRERREAHRANLSIDVKQAVAYGTGVMNNGNGNGADESGGFGLGISDITPRPSMDGYASRNAPAVAAASLLASKPGGGLGGAKPKVEIDEPTPTSPTISYTTTDDEDVLHIGRNTSIRGPQLTSLSSGSDSFFARVGTIPRRRTISRARSPLSLSGLATTPLLPAEDDWDYTETEWWGWVILIVTWVVFVVGMGSCFGIWSWAWDVGTTPYAPPELEDDPTLPITGYYPALIILTCVMAWVWVVIAWVGMKYFRHAKISGE